MQASNQFTDSWIDVRRYGEIVSALVAAEGGDRVPEVRMQIIRRFASCCVLAERLEAHMARGTELGVSRYYCAVVNTLARLAAALNIDNVPTPLPSITDYLNAAHIEIADESA